MTSPSRRKLRITLPSTPTFADALRLAIAVPALVALAAALAAGAEATRGGHAPWTGYANSASLTSSQEPADALAEKLAAPRLNVRAPAAARPDADKTTSGAAVEPKAKKKRRAVIRPAGFDAAEVRATTGRNAKEPQVANLVDEIPTLDDFDEPVTPITSNRTRGTDSSRGAVKPTTAVVEALVPSPPVGTSPSGPFLQHRPYEPSAESEQEIEARRARLRAQLTRPFKQMKEIRPFFDYEPDGEVLEADRCFNLCPWPGSPHCPDCDQAGPDGMPQGRRPCPECPVEIDLRDTARVVASVNDLPTRNFAHIQYCWEPTNLYSYPLYFEDHCLERYGHTRHYLLQPVFSVVFTAQFVGLPYQMTIDPIAKKRDALGWYRPGQYVPYKYYQVPWNTEAALVEAGVIAGAYFLFAPGVGP